MTPDATEAGSLRGTPVPSSTSRVFEFAVALLVAAALAACDSHRGGALPGRATDEWTRTYTLAEGGEFQIVGSVGSIDVQGGTGSTIEVKAARVVKAGSDDAAAQAAARVHIGEDVAADKVVLRSEGLKGIIIGLELEVNYHVTVPSATRLRLHTAAGNITVANVNGVVVASTADGAVTGTALGGGVDARSTNGDITMDLAEVSRDAVDLRAANGKITLTLPPTANANVEANCTNGAIDVADLALQLTGEQSPRRVRGRFNDGGTPVEATTTNGDIQIRPRP